MADAVIWAEAFSDASASIISDKKTTLFILLIFPVSDKWIKT
jgi:hypothetical protein